MFPHFYTRPRQNVDKVPAFVSVVHCIRQNPTSTRGLDVPNGTESAPLQKEVVCIDKETHFRCAVHVTTGNIITSAVPWYKEYSHPSNNEAPTLTI
jgi:hypothetical protein